MSDYPSYDEQVQQRVEDVVVDLNLAEPVPYTPPPADWINSDEAIPPAAPDETLEDVQAKFPHHVITRNDDGSYDVLYEPKHMINTVASLRDVPNAAHQQTFFEWLVQ